MTEQKSVDEYNLLNKENNFGLNPKDYKILYQQSNRGDKVGLPHGCKYDNQFIEVGSPLIRVTKIVRVEFSDRKFFSSWLFHKEECLKKWLVDNNPEWML